MMSNNIFLNRVVFNNVGIKILVSVLITTSSASSSTFTKYFQLRATISPVSSYNINNYSPFIGNSFSGSISVRVPKFPSLRIGLKLDLINWVSDKIYSFEKNIIYMNPEGYKVGTNRDLFGHNLFGIAPVIYWQNYRWDESKQTKLFLSYLIAKPGELFKMQERLVNPTANLPVVQGPMLGITGALIKPLPWIINTIQCVYIKDAGPIFSYQVGIKIGT